MRVVKNTNRTHSLGPRFRLLRKELERLKKEISVLRKRQRSISLLDAQTGFFSRQYLAKAIEAEFQRAKRYTQPLTAVLIDIDYFRSVNILYGQYFGDLVLGQFARLLRKNIRPYDIVVRLGGEEFLILFPKVNKPQAQILVQRIFEELTLRNFGNSSKKLKLRVSMAVAVYPDEKIARGADLVDLCDRILEKIKEAGGNKVYFSQQLNNKPRLGRRDVKSLRYKISRLTRNARQDSTEAIFAFAKTLELKDHYTGEHVEHTVHFATEIAKELGLSREDIELVRQAAILHDLGKIGIREDILKKRAKLTKKEFEEIKKHPQIGADIIRPIRFLHGLIPLIFYHHERWDGRGYPSGIKKEEIPIGARIISIADVYQALTSDRPYRRAYLKPEAIKIIKQGSGSQFDPRIVEAFLRVIKR